MSFITPPKTEEAEIKLITNSVGKTMTSVSYVDVNLVLGMSNFKKKFKRT